MLRYMVSEIGYGAEAVYALMHNQQVQYTCSIIFIVWAFYYCLKKNKPKLLGIYSQPGKWFLLKYQINIFLVRIEYIIQLFAMLFGYSKKSKAFVSSIEQPQTQFLDKPNIYPKVRKIIYGGTFSGVRTVYDSISLYA